jgi:hypothetical protein
MYSVAKDCRCEVHRRERGPVNLGVGEAARDTRAARQESAFELDSMKVVRWAFDSQPAMTTSASSHSSAIELINPAIAVSVPVTPVQPCSALTFT